MLNSDSKTILLNTLQSHWGYNSLRTNQEGPVYALAEGCNTIALLPTGAGKSLCFQLPALYRGGLCLVVSPLIALMEDQTHQLKLNNAKAASLTGGLGRSGIDRVLENACLGKLDFLYLSPERLEDPMFKARTSRLDVRTIVVDEAHCISEWGHDFRPEYSKISKLKDVFPDAVWGAYTATATKDVLDDIVIQLKIEAPEVFISPLRRNNLKYQINSWGDPEVEILHQAVALNSKYPDGSGLLYVKSRAEADKFAQRLKSLNLSTDSFHAGLSTGTKQNRQRSWIRGKTKIMACTSAFGMGIDKPDVRWILHFNLPNTLESYVQEAGRAGRDGKDAECIAFIDKPLKEKSFDSISNQFPNLNQIQAVYQNISNQGRIAIGDNPDSPTSFSIIEAIDKLKLKRTLIRSCLNTLENRGYIEVKESIVGDGTVVWLGGKNRMLNEIDNLNSRLTQDLMRISTSPTSEIKISLSQWSSKLMCKKDELLNALTALDSSGLIDWSPNNGEMRVHWPTSRIDATKVTIDKEFANARRKHLENKLSSIHSYSELTTCRTLAIDKYFDSKTPDYNCGSCDNCTLNPGELIEIIKTSIHKDGTNAYELIRKFPAGHRHEVSTILRTMLDSKKIYAEGTMVFNSSVT